MENEMNMPSYGNWVSKRLIVRILVLMVVFAAGAIAAYFFPALLALGILLTCIAFFFLAKALYFLAARYVLSYEGGGVQEKVLDLLVSHIPDQPYSNILDIGCGSGALAVKLSKKFREAHITGFDSWQGNRGYSIAQCQKNMRLEGADGRMSFVQGTASKLPFKDGAFDLVVSNFAFHKIHDAKNKWNVVAEALRVLKNGGTYVFQDLFLVKSIYGPQENLEVKIKSLGVSKAVFVNTSNEEFISRLLKLSFMLGKIGILHGMK